AFDLEPDRLVRQVNPLRPDVQRQLFRRERREPLATLAIPHPALRLRPRAARGLDRGPARLEVRHGGSRRQRTREDRVGGLLHDVAEAEAAGLLLLAEALVVAQEPLHTAGLERPPLRDAADASIR